MDTDLPDVAVRPRVVDIGVVLAIVAAAVNVYIAVLLMVQVTQTRVAVPVGLVVVVVSITVLFSAALVAFALLFRAGRAWGRAGVLVLSALSLLTLFAPNALNLIVTALLIAADILVYRRSASGWSRLRSTRWRS